MLIRITWALDVNDVSQVNRTNHPPKDFSHIHSQTVYLKSIRFRSIFYDRPPDYTRPFDLEFRDESKRNRHRQLLSLDYNLCQMSLADSNSGWVLDCNAQERGGLTRSGGVWRGGVPEDHHYYHHDHPYVRRLIFDTLAPVEKREPSSLFGAFNELPFPLHSRVIGWIRLKHFCRIFWKI